MLIEIAGEMFEVPDGSTHATMPDGSVIPIDYDDSTDLASEVERLAQSVGMRPERDAQHLDAALQDVETQIGRQLTADERGGLAELAMRRPRLPDGTPDVSLIAPAMQSRIAIDELGLTDEQRQAFVQQAPVGADGLPDVEALTALQAEAARPQRPADDAGRDAWNTYLAERTQEMLDAQQHDRQQRASERAGYIADGVDPGPADSDLRPWEREGRAPNLNDRDEMLAAQVDQLNALNSGQAA